MMSVVQHFILLFTLLSAIGIHGSPTTEITKILDNAVDLTVDEVAILRPIFNNLQLQYDYINVQSTGLKEAGIFSDANMDELDKYFGDFLQLQPNIKYDSSLPTVNDLIGSIKFNATTEEEANELLDMQSILEEALEDAQRNINNIILQALRMESNLLRLNKPKLVQYIYQALSVLFKISTQTARAAYCTYSHIPELNQSLQSIHDGVDCYTYTTHLIVRVQNETVHTVGTIRKNVFDLAAVYQKVASKKSIVGKLFSLILNVSKIARDVQETYAVAQKALTNLQDELPQAAKQSVNCGSDFVKTIPQMQEVVSNLTTCVLFVDNTIEDYNFMFQNDTENL